jgi:hypothetical protein
MEEVLLEHGNNGDNCWEPKVCHSRRSHARHKDRRNQARLIKKKQEQLLVLQQEETIIHAVLVIYRTSPITIHAVGCDIYNGNNKISSIEVIHCMSYNREQIHEYIKNLISYLKDKYNIVKFSSFITLSEMDCPIQGCFIRHKNVKF